MYIVAKISMRQDQNKKAFNELLKTLILPKVEIIGLIVFLFALVLRTFEMGAYQQLLMISLTTLAITLYLRGFIREDKRELLDVVTVRVGYISSAVTIVGILFHDMVLGGAKEMLTIGITTLAIAYGIAFYQLTKPDYTFYRPVIFRFSLVFVVVAILYFL